MLSSQSPALDVCIRRSNVPGGTYLHYEVPVFDSQTVLDVVTWIQRNREPSLSYRFSCRVGVCGTCAMTVNGKPRWTCRTHVQQVVRNNKLTIEPLRNLPVIKDLACDMSGFFDKWDEARGRFRPTQSRDDPVAPIRPASKHRKIVDAGIECINCAVCYAACDVVAWNPDYLGPAALNRAWTLLNDERDGGRTERLRAMASAAGCHNCHSHHGCSNYCPVELNPTASIAGLKRMTSAAGLKGEI